MKFNFDTMNNNTSEKPPQENENLNEDDNFELDEETSEEMENAIDEIPEIKEWEGNKYNKEEKLDIINVRGEEIEEKIAEDMGIDVEKNIEEIETEIKDFRDSLKDKSKEYAGMKDNLSQIRGANIEEGEGLDKMKEVLSSLSGIYENQLEIEYLEYWKKYKEDPKLLLESHAKRNLVMNNWETLIGNLKTAEEGEEEVLKAWAQWVKDNPEITLAALALAVAAGVVMGALLCPEIAAALAAIGGEQAEEEVIKKVIEEAGPAVKKTSIWVATTGFTGGAIVGGGILGKAISWISKEENRDKLAEGLCGAKISGIAYLFGGRPGEKK